MLNIEQPKNDQLGRMPPTPEVSNATRRFIRQKEAAKTELGGKS